MNESVNAASQSRYWSPECSKVTVITLGVCAALVLTRDRQLDLKLRYKNIGLDVSVLQPYTSA